MSVSCAVLVLATMFGGLVPGLAQGAEVGAEATDSVQQSAEADIALQQPANAARTAGTDYFMLLDASGSMGTNDPDQVAVLATEIVDALLNDDDRLWVGRHAEASVVWELSEAGDSNELRQRLFRRVVREVRDTDCRTGLQLTAQAIDSARRADPHRKQVILALGDGNCIGDEVTPNYAEFVGPVMNSHLDVPVLFVGLSAQARAACRGLERLPRQNEQIFVHCVDEPLPGNSREKSLVSAFVDVFRVGMGLSEVVEASSDDPRMSGCLASSQSKLLVLSDRDVSVSLVSIDADGDETQAQFVTVTDQSPSTPFAGIRGRDTLYTYQVLEFETDAAQVEVRVTPDDARWRAIFVPIVDGGGDRLNARTPRVTGDGCTEDAVWHENRGTPHRFSTADELCFDARLFGRCGGRDRDVRMRVLRADGAAEEELKLKRVDSGNRFWTVDEDFQCSAGMYSAQVIADSIGSAGIAEVSVALEFECESCRLAAGSRAEPEVSWCREDERRTARVVLPLADDCDEGAVTLPPLPAPYDRCASWTAGQVTSNPDGTATVEVTFVLTPGNDACDVEALSDESAVSVPLPDGGEITLAPTFYDPLDELVLRAENGGESVGYDRCSPNDNFGHLSLINRSSCAMDIDAVSMSVSPSSGGTKKVALKAFDGDSTGENIEDTDGAVAPLESGSQLALAGLHTSRPLCGLEGTENAGVAVVDGWGRSADAGTTPYAFAAKEFNTKDWWICYALLARTAVVGLIALCLLLLLLIGAFGYPPVRRAVRLRVHKLPDEMLPSANSYYQSFNDSFGYDVEGTAQRGNAWIARFLTGRMKYDLRVVTERLSRDSSTQGPGSVGEAIQTDPIVRVIDEQFSREWSSDNVQELDSIRPHELTKSQTDLDHVSIKAGFSSSGRRGISREAVAFSMGPFFHRIRIPVWILLILGLFLFWFVHRMLAAAC